MVDTSGVPVHGLLLSTKVEGTVEWIVEKAVHLGTTKAYQEASLQLQGLDRFLQMMGLSIDQALTISPMRPEVV